MSLTDEQKEILAHKLAQGASIAEIQKHINEEFKLPLTYMDTRFLIDDLDLKVVDAQKKAKPDHDLSKPLPKQDKKKGDDEFELMDEDGSVSVEVDRVKRPGAAISGTVSFSDGQNAKWFVDPMGRLGLEPDQEGYQPSPEDIETFQNELQKALQGPGI